MPLEKSSKATRRGSDDSSSSKASIDSFRGSLSKTNKASSPSGSTTTSKSTPTQGTSSKGPAIAKSNGDSTLAIAASKGKSASTSPKNSQDGSASDSLTSSAGSSMSPPPVKKEPKQLREPVEKYEPRLYGDLADATEEATSTFEVVAKCIYTAKYLGDSQQSDAHCECRPQFTGDQNSACGEESNCINRMTLMECVTGDSGCEGACQNQRFQTCAYADVSVFKTAKKGFGLRANSDIPAGRFIIEYVGEVIDESRFRQRNAKYPSQGIKHFYFMSLEKDQFIDATIKGGLARFVNHSCNPNCETEKWIVGNKYRMGIFAKRGIKAGEELVFDYNVDRYGAEKQPCYCGEPNCLGYIGGKTQTDSAPKLSGNVIEALGINEDDIPTKKSRRPKKTDEDDGEYLAKIQTRPLDFKGVATVMGTLANTKEKWIVSKLVARIEQSDEEDILSQVLRFHGYTIVGKFLTLYEDDDDIVSTILSIFIKFPKITKNKISAAGIEPIVEKLALSPIKEIHEKAARLIEVWSTLETSYRIPRRVITDQPEQKNTAFLDRSRDSKSNSQSPNSISPEVKTEPIPPWIANKKKHNKPNFVKQPPRGPRAERGRGGFANRGGNKFGPRPQYENPNLIPTVVKPKELPWGWHKCYQFNECYYYSNDGEASWEFPTHPCQGLLPKTIPPPPPTAAQIRAARYVVQEAAAKGAILMQKREEEDEKTRVERERLDQQERNVRRKPTEEESKIYDAAKTKRYLTIAFGKHIPNMVNKYHRDLGSSPKDARENVKKYAKEITQLLIDKEMRYHKRIVDPLNVCDAAKLAKIKIFVDEFVRKLIQRRKASREKSDSPGVKRKRSDNEPNPSAGDVSKRLKSPMPVSVSHEDAAVILPVSSPTRKRTLEDSQEGRESPKKRKSPEGSPNGITSVEAASVMG